MKLPVMPEISSAELPSPSVPAALITCEGVGRFYGEEGARTIALTDVDLGIGPGESVAVIGASGSGKSTLLNLIGALDRPSAGRIVVAGRDLAGLDDREASRFRREETGFVFQLFNLVPTLSALDNVALPARLAGESTSTSRQRAAELLARVGLEGLEDSTPDALSGGQQQRVAIARALINRPSIILADEPTGALDSKAGEQVLDLLLELVEESGATLLLATHSEEAVERMRRTIRFEDGRIVEDSHAD